MIVVPRAIKVIDGHCRKNKTCETVAEKVERVEGKAG